MPVVGDGGGFAGVVGVVVAAVPEVVGGGLVVTGRSGVPEAVPKVAGASAAVPGVAGAGAGCAVPGAVGTVGANVAVPGSRH